MTAKAYITDIASFLPNAPVNNDEIENVLGMVNGVPDFADQPKVINGCSDLLVEILGERGRHARSAVGMGSLPGNISVEIEAIIKIHP